MTDKEERNVAGTKPQHEGRSCLHGSNSCSSNNSSKSTSNENSSSACICSSSSSSCSSSIISNDDTSGCTSCSSNSSSSNNSIHSDKRVTPSSPSSPAICSKPKKKQKAFDWSQQQVQRLLLKIAYNGEAYAAEASGISTVEGELFKALEKACLIPSRTAWKPTGKEKDGRPLALQQLAAAAVATCSSICYTVPEEQHSLPDFAFDCLYRVYKYFFTTNGLDLKEMQTAAKQFLGFHNFLRFCKVDKKQERTLWRRIIRFDLKEEGEGFAVATIVGVSFLWHQVRFMMAALMEVGSGAQPPTFISDLLKEGEEAEEEQRAAAAAGEAGAAAAHIGGEAAAATDYKTDRGGRQGLTPAPACNLVLYDCCFEGLYFSRSGVVNLLMGPQTSSSSLSSAPATNATEEEKDKTDGDAKAARDKASFEQERQQHLLANAATKQQEETTASAAIAAANVHPPICGLGVTPCSTEESRTFQEEYLRSAQRMMVLKCLCEHSLPPW
ncbi:hypothetical protein, conserved [Eimeria brunetti]|uniref:tRNA pseudouridine synthase n=1 Tax=Eimeria brunetti TaxID=51314 RepID=U6LJ97_9EIME|nr:hypothetical protein, conserved [Eimeria brunetti]